MRHFSVVIGFAAALAGCGGGGVALENASVEEVAAATKDAKKLKPGLWRTSVEIVSVDMPGIPPAQKAMADEMTKSVKARTNTSEYCVSKEQSEKPPAEIFGGNGDCTFENFALADRKLAAKMICQPKGQPAKMAITVNGSYGSKAYALDSQMQTSLPAGPGAPGGMAMVVKSRVKGERIGDCAKS